MKKISIYCFILISLGFIGCTSKTHEKTIEDFDIREMSLQVDTLYSRMTQAERVAQLYGIRPKEIMEDGKLSLEKCKEKISDGIGHICQYACALDMEPNELRDFVRDLQNYLIHETPSGIPAIFHEEAITGLAAKGATVYRRKGSILRQPVRFFDSLTAYFNIPHRAGKIYGYFLTLLIFLRIFADSIRKYLYKNTEKKRMGERGKSKMESGKFRKAADSYRPP